MPHACEAFNPYRCWDQCISASHTESGLGGIAATPPPPSFVRLRRPRDSPSFHSGWRDCPHEPAVSAFCASGGVLMRPERAVEPRSHPAIRPCAAWSGWRDSNPRPSASGGLSTKLSFESVEPGATLAGFEELLATQSLRTRLEGFVVNQMPRSSAACGFCLTAIMLKQAPVKVLRTTNVAPPGPFASQNIHGEHGDVVMVGLAGFEPAASSSRTKRSTKLSHSPFCEGRKLGGALGMVNAKIRES